MRKIELTLYELAERYMGVSEISGEKNHPLISWWLSLCKLGLFSADEIAWCSAFVNGMAWELRLPRSYSAMARSWLRVGRPISAVDLQIGFDIVVLKRGGPGQPGPEVLNAPGHVMLFSGFESLSNGKPGVTGLGGNQNNRVCLATYDCQRILGCRRLREAA